MIAATRTMNKPHIVLFVHLEVDERFLETRMRLEICLPISLSHRLRGTDLLSRRCLAVLLCSSGHTTSGGALFLCREGWSDSAGMRAEWERTPPVRCQIDGSLIDSSLSPRCGVTHRRNRLGKLHHPYLPRHRAPQQDYVAHLRDLRRWNDLLPIHL